MFLHSGCLYLKPCCETPEGWSPLQNHTLFSGHPKNRAPVLYGRAEGVCGCAVHGCDMSASIAQERRRGVAAQACVPHSTAPCCLCDPVVRPTQPVVWHTIRSLRLTPQNLPHSKPKLILMKIFVLIYWPKFLRLLKNIFDVGDWVNPLFLISQFEDVNYVKVII